MSKTVKKATTQPSASKTSIAVDQFSDKTVFGFWVYLMTDCILFATLLATFAILRNSTAGGPGGAELFSLPFVLAETIILLVSSFTSGLVLVALNRQRGPSKPQVLLWLGVTFALGATFLGMELVEFTKLVQEGHSWQQSGFLSAYFTLVGTHGLHIAGGLIWMLVLFIKIIRQQFNRRLVKRLTMFNLFWHLLDIVWIFIFSVVYLMGAV